MDIEKLAEITAKEFARVDERFQGVDKRLQGVDQRLDRLEKGQVRLESGIRSVLEAVLEIPTKKVFEKLVHKVEDIDARVTVVERKLQPISPRG